MNDDTPNLVPGQYCYWINPSQDAEATNGYVPSIVIEGESGHYPLMGRSAFASPWIFGQTLEAAERVASHLNTEKLHLTPERVDAIVTSSLLASFRGAR